MRRGGRSVAVVAGAFALMAGGCSPDAPAPRSSSAADGAAPGALATTSSPTPSVSVSPAGRPGLVMAALGDSVTRGFQNCSTPRTDCPAASWSTGDRLDSHATRLQALGEGPVTTHNDAASGSRVADLRRQVAAAVTQRPDCVTILTGNNDSCRPTEAAMTSVDSFARSAGRALSTLSRELPSATVLVVGQPDPVNLLEAGRGDDTVVATWDRLQICPSALADPRSTSEDAVARRARVRDRVRAYNETWRALCAEIPRCHYTDAVFDFHPTVADLSPVDYFHPSPAGQQALAALTWSEQATWLSGA